MDKPHLLFLAHRIPYPPNKGDKIRSFNILSHLRRHFHVHLGAFIDDPDDWQYEDTLRAVCGEVCLIERSGPGKLLSAAHGLFDDAPLSVALWSDPRMRSFVQRVIDRYNVRHSYVFSGQMAGYMLRHLSSRRMFIMDFVDMDSDKFTQYVRTSSWPMKRIYQREAVRLRQFEKQIARTADACLFVSEDEAALFRRHAGSYGHTVYALENGVDLEFFTPLEDETPVGERPPLGLVFTGAMDYRPNIEAAEWMVEDILPRVRDAVPGTHFTIVGSNPSRRIEALGGRPGVTVTGRVPDVRPFIAAADVSVAPIRTARGVQNKVLEAMAMGKPVVATDQAYAGISAEAGRDLIVTSGADAFAAAVVDLAKDGDARRRIGEAARKRMEEHYSWDRKMAVLDTLIERHERGAG